MYIYISMREIYFDCWIYFTRFAFSKFSNQSAVLGSESFIVLFHLLELAQSSFSVHSRVETALLKFDHWYLMRSIRVHIIHPVCTIWTNRSIQPLPIGCNLGHGSAERAVETLDARNDPTQLRGVLLAMHPLTEASDWAHELHVLQFLVDILQVEATKRCFNWKMNINFGQKSTFRLCARVSSWSRI